MAADFTEGSVSFCFTVPPHKGIAKGTHSLGHQVVRTLGLEQKAGQSLLGGFCHTPEPWENRHVLVSLVLA